MLLISQCCNVECRYGLSQDDVDTRATFAGEIPIESKSLFDAFAANSRLQLQQHSQALSKFDGISARAHLMSRDSSSSSPPSAAAAGSKANDMAFNANQLQVQRAACHHISRGRLHAHHATNVMLCFLAQVQHIVAEQDAGLTQLGQSVRLLGDMGRDITVELGQQQRIIDEFDTELNVVTGRFSQAQAKISQVMLFVS
jgi:hypothetical protein